MVATAYRCADIDKEVRDFSPSSRRGETAKRRADLCLHASRACDPIRRSPPQFISLFLSPHSRVKIPALMGVSKAILESVIFVHQEDGASHLSIPLPRYPDPLRDSRSPWN